MHTLATSQDFIGIIDLFCHPWSIEEEETVHLHMKWSCIKDKQSITETTVDLVTVFLHIPEVVHCHPWVARTCLSPVGTSDSQIKNKGIKIWKSTIIKTTMLNPIKMYKNTAIQQQIRWEMPILVPSTNYYKSMVYSSKENSLNGECMLLDTKKERTNHFLHTQHTHIQNMQACIIHHHHHYSKSL